MVLELGISAFVVAAGSRQLYVHDGTHAFVSWVAARLAAVGFGYLAVEHHRGGLWRRQKCSCSAVNTNIHLTVRCGLDPIRLFQQYATIDALSNGRGSMAGRGSFESFPLFVIWLEKDYEALFVSPMKDQRLARQLTQSWKRSFTSSSSGPCHCGWLGEVM